MSGAVALTWLEHRRTIFTDNTAVDIPRELEHLRLGRAQLEAEGKRKRVELAERRSARDWSSRSAIERAGFSPARMR
jgi:hypothetical protein